MPYPLKFHRGKTQAYIYKAAARERVALLEAANADADKSVESADSVAGSGSAATDNATDSHTDVNTPMDTMAGGFHDQASGNKLADDVERGENSGTMQVGGVGVVRNDKVLRETGARRVLDPVSLEAWDVVESKYDAIRANSSDVAKIAENIGWSESRVARIKEHVFFKEHQLDSGLKRFDADPDMYNAWNRLERGDYVDADIDLLRHEIFESKFEGIFKTDYRTAHDRTVDSGRTWTPE